MKQRNSETAKQRNSETARRYLKSLILCMGLMLMTFGCQKEEIVESKSSGNSQPSLEVELFDWKHFEHENKLLAKKIKCINYVMPHYTNNHG